MSCLRHDKRCESRAEEIQIPSLARPLKDPVRHLDGAQAQEIEEHCSPRTASNCRATACPAPSTGFLGNGSSLSLESGFRDSSHGAKRLD